MAEEIETEEIVEVEETPRSNESKVLGVSVRGWITIILTIAVCVLSIIEIEIEEPLYSAFLLAIGFYFGQKVISA